MTTGRIILYIVALGIAVVSTVFLTHVVRQQSSSIAGQNHALLLKTPKITTENWAVFNVKTGAILYGNNVDKKFPIASITKLYTAYIIMHTQSMRSSTTITRSDLSEEGDFGKLIYGETVTLGGLLFPLLIESSNDAGAAITRTLGPYYYEFINGVLRELNLTHTTIVDGTGLSKDNISTSRELALFFAHLRTKYPHITDITQLKMHITKSAGLVNNNPARSIPGFTGGKQGYTDEAGKTFVGSFLIQKGSNEIGIILLGSKNLSADLNRILALLR